MLQTYGFQHMVTLHNLETVGLLRPQGTTRNYPTIRKTLRLIVEEIDEQVVDEYFDIYSYFACV